MHQNLHCDLDQACMKAMVSLLELLPIQSISENFGNDGNKFAESEAGSNLFYEYLSFFLKVLQKCRTSTTGVFLYFLKNFNRF